MAQVKVTCNGLGSGSGPTLGGVLTAIGDALEVLPQEDENIRRVVSKLLDAEEELGAVRSALDECHQAVRRHWQSVS